MEKSRFVAFRLFNFIKKGGDVKNFSKVKKPCPEAKILTRRKNEIQ